MREKKSFGSARAWVENENANGRHLDLEVGEALRLAAALQRAAQEIMRTAICNSKEPVVRVWYCNAEGEDGRPDASLTVYQAPRKRPLASKWVPIRERRGEA